VDEAVNVVQSLNSDELTVFGDEIITSDIKIFDKKAKRANHIQPNVIKLTILNREIS
jgi:hypothetical protein